MMALQVGRFLAGLALAALVFAGRTPTIERRLISAANLDIKDFTISDVVALSQYISSTSTNQTSKVRTYDQSLQFDFFDNNSNTSMKCERSWEDKGTTGTLAVGAPTSYVLCGIEAPGENFSFRFAESYTKFGSFVLNLAHQHHDDVNLTPPFDIETFFAIGFHLDLDCSSHIVNKSQSLTSCNLPRNQTSITAIVNGVSA